MRKILVDTDVAVSAAAGSSSRPDLFEIFVQMAEGHKSEEALGIIDREVASLQRGKITLSAFERALNQERLNLYGDISDNSELGNWLGEFLMIGGNYMRGFEIIEGYQRISPADIQRVAKEYLKKEARSIVIVRPQGRATGKAPGKGKS